MTIFTGEYITYFAIIATLFAFLISSLVKKIKKIKTKRVSEQNKKIRIGLYLSIFNILYFIIILSIFKFI